MLTPSRRTRALATIGAGSLALVGLACACALVACGGHSALHGPTESDAGTDATGAIVDASVVDVIDASLAFGIVDAGPMPVAPVFETAIEDCDGGCPSGDFLISPAAPTGRVGRAERDRRTGERIRRPRPLHFHFTGVAAVTVGSLQDFDPPKFAENGRALSAWR